MSYKGEVIADSSGKWSSNALCFATEGEAKLYIADLMMRWTAVRETRVVESDDPVNYAIIDGRTVCLEDRQ
jgi:hypothetical protein